MAVLNARWATDRPRRSPNTVQAPTRRRADRPEQDRGGQGGGGVRRPGELPRRSGVAVDSKTTSSRPSTATSRHQLISPNGPRMSTTAATMTTAPMYSRAAHESLAKPSPLTARSVERGLGFHLLTPTYSRRGRHEVPGPPAPYPQHEYSAGWTHGADLPNVQLPTAQQISP